MIGPVLAGVMSALCVVVAGVCLHRSIWPPPQLDNVDRVDLVDRVIEGIFAIVFLVLAYLFAVAASAGYPITNK